MSDRLPVPSISGDTYPVASENSFVKSSVAFSGWPVFCAIFVVAALGLWWMITASQARVLWEIWTGSGLASVGILIPPASAILIALAWRDQNWNSDGTWWGLALCMFTLFMSAFVKGYGSPVVLVSTVKLHLLPMGLFVFLYVSGVVLLFAGYRAYRVALFPISLLLLINPAPSFFLAYIDLPLQYIGAHTARAFAGLVGVSLASDNLRLMFSPALGMFVAPGCNGLRGALTMGLLTLVVGYLYRMPVWLRLFYVVGGVVLAYLLNLVRLCGLVLCYRVALGFEPLARHMEAADYVLGSLIFLSGAVFVFALPRKWKNLRKQYVNS
jgi:exosortase J